MTFLDRNDAGRRLAIPLERLKAEEPVVIGLPRGGVVVAAEIARALGAPLDVLIVRKLGTPWRPELAMGAIAEGGFRIVNRPIVHSLGITEGDIDRVASREEAELERRKEVFRKGRPAIKVKGRTVIVADDGIATGATASVAAKALRAQGAYRLVLAVPVSSPEALDKLAADFDEVVCLEAPAFLMAIGEWYQDFEQVSDDSVVALLEKASLDRGVRPGATEDEVEIEADGVCLPGSLSMPTDTTGLVVFAHGSGSGRYSPRNQAVATHLNREGLGTLLFDLLSKDEEGTRANVFDIPLLAERLRSATRWARRDPRTAQLPLGYFGASTGAAAALWAAATDPESIYAVVSRGGRPDLAGKHLKNVRAPTLLIVGGDDHLVIELNRDAETMLSCEKRLEIVPGASHLFEEPGTLERVADLATAWFRSHLSATGSDRDSGQYHAAG